ncbi:hypothetical protein RhiTH_006688 [Rhizoctonia solani]|nr:hypothetical protein RHS04_05190 [Rhizoctonia solani]KAF8756546.1 hypothetical protein RHS01_04552 [Rhizoctonia solani]
MIFVSATPSPLELQQCNKDMGRRTVVVTALQLEGDVWQQLNDNTLLPEALDVGISPDDNVPALTGTHLGTSETGTLPLELVPAGPCDGGILQAEEEDDYDMCALCSSPQDDDYVLVEPEASLGSYQAHYQTSETG